MAQTKQQIQAHLAAANTQPRHRFGQNFMIDQNLVRLIADAASITPADTIIEVGPGTGTLTEELLQRAGRLIAVEIDRDLAAHLRTAYADRPNFTLIEGDALDGKHAVNPDLRAALQVPPPAGEARRGPPIGGAIEDRQQPASAAPTQPPPEGEEPKVAPLRNVKLVANLPYNIASPLVIELLLIGVEQLVFTVQKEVADRLKGRADSDDYGPLTVMVQLLSRVEVLRTLPPGAFWPPPKIDSALVRLTRDNRLGDRARPFGLFVQKVFSFRRKTLRKAVDMAGFAVPFDTLGFDPTLRAEAFTPEQLLAMFDHRQQ